MTDKKAIDGVVLSEHKTISKHLLVIPLQKDRALYVLELDELQRSFQPQAKLEAEPSRKAGYPIQRAPQPHIPHSPLRLHSLVPLEQVPTMKAMTKIEQWKQRAKCILFVSPHQLIAYMRLLK